MMARRAARALGTELRRLRERANLSRERVGAVFGWSTTTGTGPATGHPPEEVAAVLATMGVVGVERDRAMLVAFGVPPPHRQG